MLAEDDEMPGVRLPEVRRVSEPAVPSDALRFESGDGKKSSRVPGKGTPRP